MLNVEAARDYAAAWRKLAQPSSASRASSTSDCCAAREIFETVETPRDLRRRVPGRGQRALRTRARDASTRARRREGATCSATCSAGDTARRHRAHHPRPRRAVAGELQTKVNDRLQSAAQGRRRSTRPASPRRSPTWPSAATSPRSWCGSEPPRRAPEAPCAAAGPVGKQIEFLLQEIHREINTIGSKANQLEITRLVVEAKGEVERLREQVQNVE